MRSLFSYKVGFFVVRREGENRSCQNGPYLLKKRKRVALESLCEVLNEGCGEVSEGHSL